MLRVPADLASILWWRYYLDAAGKESPVYLIVCDKITLLAIDKGGILNSDLSRPGYNFFPGTGK